MTFKVGDSVASLPGSLAYYCGDRRGTVEKVEDNRIMVRMDGSKRLVPFRPDQLTVKPDA